MALAFQQQGDFENAAKTLKSSLADCSNYAPAASALIGCCKQLGRTDEAAALKAQWGVDDGTWVVADHA